ncbi:hypothetical protein BS47DRAFT_1389169 [Hydnum rufescens UP504]|uniref:Uncharacterized protein n=1 Tax=Hydnum rufescens UP504 TaxID=1448309 RepID=A0A9P6B642_9AGAM|nr:hypothetical protein BS47DRAFT_1389169 [Hydnum rufescens UP504]
MSTSPVERLGDEVAVDALKKRVVKKSIYMREEQRRPVGSMYTLNARLDTDCSGAETLEVWHYILYVRETINAVLDILPGGTLMLIEACLGHPSFPGCNKIYGPRSFASPGVDSRKNAFDDDPPDFSKAKIGKNSASDYISAHENADTVLWDKTLALNTKGDTGAGCATLAFEVELSGGGFEGALRLKVAQEGEGSGGEDADGTGRAADRVEDILELAYTNDPKLFDRDSGTRRPKARQNPKAETDQSILKSLVSPDSRLGRR